MIAAACVIQAAETRSRGIDPDELEHLHATYCVSRGDVPYRDFFEHHAPALYYVLCPLFKAVGLELSDLWLARRALWCCSLVTLALTWRLASRWGGERAGLTAAALLAWSTIFHSKGIELRPDVPATLLLTLAVCSWTFASGGGSWRRFLWVGHLSGLALLFTQKSLVPVAGIALAACLARAITRDRQAENLWTVLARVAVPLAAGIAACWGLASLGFALAGAAGAFWHSTWYQLWIWPVHSSRWEALRPTLVGDLTVWIAATFEIVTVIRRSREPGTWERQRGVAAIVALTCIASIPFVKATYSQFYLLWMPCLAALAGTRICTLVDKLRARGRAALMLILGGGLVGAQALLWHRALSAGPIGALPYLTAIPAARIAVWVMIALALIVLTATVLRQKWSIAVGFVAVLGMAHGALRDVNAALWSNREQVAAIEAINRLIPPDGRVLDGFTGYAALRPHAWYYWWVNEYSLALVPPDELATLLLDNLERQPPAGILFDRNLALLPPRVTEWITAHYEPHEPEPLWLPRRRLAR
jgi:hypothetical protein